MRKSYDFKNPRVMADEEEEAYSKLLVKNTGSYCQASNMSIAHHFSFFVIYTFEGIFLLCNLTNKPFTCVVNRQV